MEYVATWEREWVERIEEGIIKGEKKGRKEEKKDTAKNMLKEGLPLDIIKNGLEIGKGAPFGLILNICGEQGLYLSRRNLYAGITFI
ncbi:MAG: hypothetical protein GY757_12950 [bacterium]|nr:hypothetical protein [bacterium]